MTLEQVSPTDPLMPMPSETAIDSNGLCLEGNPEGLEKILDYEPGGHHPIRLNDNLGDDGRYRVLHKLGSGGYANVWLCRNLHYSGTKYVALKILMSDASQEDCPELRINKIDRLIREEIGEAGYICLPLDQFEIHGPNGKHLVLVYPVLGPKAISFRGEPESTGRTLRSIALQAVQAMAILHRNDICHGDFTTHNILLRIKDLDSLSEGRVLQMFGDPTRVNVRTEAGDVPTSASAPPYLVRPIQFKSLGARFLTDRACVIDFGESFEISAPPEELGIPTIFASPEYLVDKTIGIGNDFWALGCTLFELRTGRRLIDSFDTEADDMLYSMNLLLGKMPEPWWSRWSSRPQMFEDEPDSDGRVQRVPAIEAEVKKLGVKEARSIREALEFGLYDRGMPDAIHQDIPAAEIELFADLLGKLLKYDPAERLTAAQALEHPWFKM